MRKLFNTPPSPGYLKFIRYASVSAGIALTIGCLVDGRYLFAPIGVMLAIAALFENLEPDEDR